MLRERGFGAGRGRKRAFAGLGGKVETLRDTEVEHLHGTLIGDEDIARLEIAMNDACGVRALEGSYDRDHEVDELAGREAVLEALRERLALEVFEHHEREPLVLSDLEDRDDVVVRAARGRSRFDHEPVREPRIGLEQKLHRDAPAELGIAREEDLPHAAAGELADQLEPTDALGDRDLDRQRTRFRTVDRAGCLGWPREHHRDPALVGLTCLGHVPTIRQGSRQSAGQIR
ncbi:MAG: hypothetical protein ABI867_26800 [Kofleriaceae bacterium]